MNTLKHVLSSRIYLCGIHNFNKTCLKGVGLLLCCGLDLNRPLIELNTPHYLSLSFCAPFTPPPPVGCMYVMTTSKLNNGIFPIIKSHYHFTFMKIIKRTLLKI